ncbi:hypothetical protein VNO77_19470 [Canavalia gladiata]|uniref:Uncharacterized protein n=1 Tax=Canavalia gladiata TaxID=3824 RepID=A0AAN9QKI9_CANGL
MTLVKDVLDVVVNLVGTTKYEEMIVMGIIFIVRDIYTKVNEAFSLIYSTWKEDLTKIRLVWLQTIRKHFSGLCQSLISAE